MKSGVPIIIGAVIIGAAIVAAQVAAPFQFMVGQDGDGHPAVYRANRLTGVVETCAVIPPSIADTGSTLVRNCRP